MKLFWGDPGENGWCRGPFRSHAIPNMMKMLILGNLARLLLVNLEKSGLGSVGVYGPLLITRKSEENRGEVH